MKIRYEMTERNPGTASYDPPDDLLVREAMTAEIGHAWEVTLAEWPDESDD